MSSSHAATTELSPSTASLHGLDGVNFFLGGVLAGFGPYVAVYLADQKWTQEKIGFVLSASALAGLLSQVPGGELLDTTRSKRVIVALGVIVVSLARIRAADIHFGRSCGAPHHHTPDRPARAVRLSLWKSPGLLVLGACLFLFQLANASMLPLIGEALIYQGESRSSLIVSALIVLPQIIVALMAPWVGRQANNWGRRPLLLIGLGALPIRALLFALVTDPPLLLAFQLLDGVSGAVVGVMTALVIADLTNGTGRFNLAQGLVGTASGIGASLSTALFGLIAVIFGRTVVFLSIASVALFAVLTLWFLMPETRPSTKPVGFSHANPLNSAVPPDQYA